MNITFDPQGGFWDAGRGRVQFLAYVDNRLKPCWVAPIAPEDLVETAADAPELEPIDYVAIYDRCREVIQRVAAEKFKQGRIEDGGVIIHTEDLEQEHGKHGSHRKITNGFWVDPRSGRSSPAT